MNKREKIIAHIEGLLANKKLKPGEKVPSEYALADMFSVNPKTANLAINTLVSKGVLRRLSGAAGTVVAQKASTLKGTITYLMSLQHHQNFWSKLLRGAQKAAFLRKYALRYLEYDPAYASNPWQDLIDSRTVGLLSTSYGTIDVQLPFPVVHVDSAFSESTTYNYVDSDNLKAGYMGTKHLLKLKHRDIVFISEGYRSTQQVQMERMTGFVQAMSEFGIEDAEERCFYHNANFTATLAQVQRRFPKFTGIVFDSDILAMKMIPTLIDNKLRVPEDVSVIGFGALTTAMPVFQITSIEQFPEDMGFLACNSLIDLIEGKSKGIITEKMPVELFHGNSTRELS